MTGDSEYDAAIGAELAVSLYGANVLEKNLEDHEQNLSSLTFPNISYSF